MVHHCCAAVGTGVAVEAATINAALWVVQDTSADVVLLQDEVRWAVCAITLLALSDRMIVGSSDRDCQQQEKGDRFQHVAL